MKAETGFKPVCSRYTTKQPIQGKFFINQGFVAFYLIPNYFTVSLAHQNRFILGYRIPLEVSCVQVM